MSPPRRKLSGNSPEILERRARRPRESAGLSEKNLAASKWRNPHADFVLPGLDRLDPAIHAFGGAGTKDVDTRIKSAQDELKLFLACPAPG